MQTAEQLAAKLNVNKNTLETKLAEYQNEPKIKAEDKDQSQKQIESDSEKKEKIISNILLLILSVYTFFNKKLKLID